MAAKKEKYTFSPAELSSERGEKEVLADSNQPTAPPSTKSHVSYCAARARRRKWRLKVHQARRDDRFSSQFLSLLLTAAIVPTRPTPLLLCSPLPPPPPSLSLSPTRFDAFKYVIVSIVHNMLPILGQQSRHLGYQPVYVGFPYDL